MRRPLFLARVAGACALAAAALSLPSGASAQAAPVAAAVQDSTSSQASPYLINPGDELEIYVWGEERLQRTVRVLPDGTIAFPLAGQIVAQGRRPQELEKIVSERLRGQYRGEVPEITVSVKAPTGMQFSVMGRVKSPGTFTPGRYVNLLEALSMAGGPSEFANLDNVVVIRKRGDALSTIRVKVAPLFKSGADASDLVRGNIQRIETGDTVIVP